LKKCIEQRLLNNVNTRMYKTQYKSRSPYESWNTLGTYSTEANAISSALQKKRRGALIVRVTDKLGGLVYIN
jgi:hypothetical protein